VLQLLVVPQLSWYVTNLTRSHSDFASSGLPGAAGADVLSTDQEALLRKTHQTIAKISDDIGRRYTFNTAVAASMELLNAVNRFDDASATGRRVVQQALEAVVVMLSPMVPHICHELWSVLGHRTALIDEPWPTADEKLLQADVVNMVVQVNGKLRGTISVPVGTDDEAVIAAALADPNVQRYVSAGTIRKTIVVPNKLVSVVV
jgi:leucyl-tRNA synthetase